MKILDTYIEIANMARGRYWFAFAFIVYGFLIVNQDLIVRL